MTKSFRRLLAAASVVIVSVAAYHGLSETSEAQVSRGSSTRSSGSNSRTVGRETFESKFWRYLKDMHYRNWAPGPGQNGDTYPGQSPHGAFLKMYFNRIAAGNADTLPIGSIIIKENYGPDGKQLMAVTAMYRSKGYDADHNDWYWVKYNPDGSVARTPADKGNKRIAGKFASCIECHSGAEGGDYVFANDAK